MYGSFTQGTVPPHQPYSSGFLFLPTLLRHRLPRPTQSRRSLGRRFSPRFRYYAVVRLLTEHRFPFRLAAYKVTYSGSHPKTLPVLLRSRTALPYRAVRNHLESGGWMSNAFAPLQQARPCPTLGRPVRLRVAPIDYGPVVLLMPFGSRLTTDTLPSGRMQRTGFGFPLAVSGFRLCARLGCSIPSTLLRPARSCPRLLDIALLI